jgi:hypothetical protein
MSTKTTFKRIALVAVASLGLSLVAVAPTNAAVNSQALYHSTPASITAGAYADFSAVTQNILLTGSAVIGIQHSFVASQAGDTATVTASLDVNVTNYVAGVGNVINSALPVLAAVAGGYATNNAGAAVNANQAVDQVAGTVATGSVAAGAVVGSFTSTFTPTQAGTYTLTYKITGETFTQTVVVHATQAALDTANGVDNVVNAAKTTSFLNAGETTTVTAAADTVVSASMALSATANATIVVTPLNAAGTAIAATALSVTITGPGSVAVGANLAAITALSTGTGRAVTGAAGSYTIGVFADGTSGASTITISSGTTVLATEKVTFYGAATKITPTVVNSVLAIGAGGGNVGAITAVVTDANGVLVPNVTVYASSNTDATIDDAYVTSTAASTAAGLVSFTLTGVAAGTAAITLTLNATSAGTSTVSALAGTMRVSDGVVTKVAYTFDKDSYAPGEAAVITATVSNAAGVMPSGSYTVLTGAVTGNYTVSGLPAATVLAVLSTGAATYTVTIPTGITGDLQLAGTASATTIAATFGKATIVNAALDAATAATDAASEAIDAANAATDAANAAAEAADAATAAAQDAADAVAALSVSVAAMIDALKKQITSLTNLVIKIQKKVKA